MRTLGDMCSLAILWMFGESWAAAQMMAMGVNMTAAGDNTTKLFKVIGY